MPRFSSRVVASVMLLACLAGCARPGKINAVTWIGQDPAHAALMCNDAQQTYAANVQGGYTAYRDAATDTVLLQAVNGSLHTLHTLKPNANHTLYKDEDYALADQGNAISLIIVSEARVLRCTRARQGALSRQR